MNKDTKLPYSENKLKELTDKDEIQWELDIQYVYELGVQSPTDHIVMGATAKFGEFTLKYGLSAIYFHYNTIVIGFIKISPTFVKAIEENGYRLIEKLKLSLDAAMET
jgi:hypothetical protein